MIYVGIDIGLKGGLCFMLEDEKPHIMQMPIDKGETDFKFLKTLFETELLDTKDEHLVVFEQLSPLHKGGKSQNWSLAEQYGTLKGLCIGLGLNFTEVPPKTWQKEMFQKIPPLRCKDGTNDTKAMAKIAIKQLYPDLNVTLSTRKNAKEHDGIIDAVLLATWLKY